jgi:hypothetical protein
MLEFSELLRKPIDPLLSGMTDNSAITTIDTYVKKCISRYIDQYNDKEKVAAEVSSTLTFFLAYLKGQLVSYGKKIILVHGTNFKVWDLNQDFDDETVLLKGLQKEPRGTFAYPACGYWDDSYDFLQDRSKPSKRRLPIVAWDKGVMRYRTPL